MVLQFSNNAISREGTHKTTNHFALKKYQVYFEKNPKRMVQFPPGRLTTSLLMVLPSVAEKVKSKSRALGNKTLSMFLLSYGVKSFIPQSLPSITF